VHFIGMPPAAREHASAWLPPGMAYADPPIIDIAHNGADASAEIDAEAADLPAFLSGDDPDDPAEAALGAE
jgi:hypothetical protein